MRRLTVLFILMLIAWLSVACGDASAPAETAAEVDEPGGETAVVDETEPAEPTTATEPVEAVETVPTAVPSPTTNTPADPTATPPLRSYALDAANLLNLVDLSQSQPLSPETTVNGRITPDALAIPYTYQAQAGEILLIELLLPNLTNEEMQAIRPAIFIAGAAGNELGYMRGGADFVTMDERRSIAQAGLVAPADGNYTVLATLDGHQNPQQNPVHTADFELTVIPATPLTINEPHEATRASFERHVYAVTTGVGEFDLVYEDLAGTPPGQYLIEVKRLGTPSDGAALHDTLAAGGAVNQTYPHQDTASATIAERMGLTELTYFIFVQSSTLPGQEQEPYTSNYRLTIMQDEGAAAPVEEAAMAGPTPTPFTSAIAADETWGTRLNHTVRVQVQIPTGWEVASGNNSIYGRDGASLTLSLEDHVFADAAAACQGLTQGIAAEAFGAGMGEIVTVNGLDVCVISHPQDGEPYQAIIKYPEPVAITGSIGPRGVWNFLRIDIQPADYFWPIVESINFPAEPSAQLYAFGVVDILKAHYYFRDQLDWATLEAELDARLDDNSTLDDAYDALYWLIEEMAATVNHHHMILRTPEQVQEALRGEQQQVGLLLDGNVVAYVYPGSPAALAGIQLGDEILTVNGVPFGEAESFGDSFAIEFERDSEVSSVTLEPQTISYIIPPRGQRYGSVVYLETFGIFGADVPLLQTYATSVHATIKEMDTADTCGWILDLRRNTGGSIHAIAAGIAPLVGDGELYRVRWLGREDTAYYENGRVFGTPLPDLPAMVNIPYVLPAPNPPLAVLISSNTTSAGEASAIIVSGRPGAQTRVFGEQTQGLTTPVFNANLYDGGLFLAPIQLAVDLEGRTYLEGVIPDEPIPVVYDERYGTQDDPVVQAALAWLEAEHGCSP